MEKKLKIDPKKVEYDGHSFRLIINDETALLEKLKEKLAEIIKDLEKEHSEEQESHDQAWRFAMNYCKRNNVSPNSHWYEAARTAYLDARQSAQALIDEPSNGEVVPRKSLKDHAPFTSKELKDRSLVAETLLECIKTDDIDTFLDVLVAHLMTTNKSKIAKLESEFKQLEQRAQLAERKLEKLKRLVLLTDPAVIDVQMNPLTMRQWKTFIEEFKDEA